MVSVNLMLKIAEVENTYVFLLSSTFVICEFYEKKFTSLHYKA